MKTSIQYILIALALTISSIATPAQSANSKWFKTDGVKIRLISLPSADGKNINGALQIELEKGWKTYWRSPGNSGIPPEISFNGSKNIASVKLHFPVPIAFGDGDNLTAGYKGSVIFPIAIEPLFQDRSVSLKVKGLLGICGEVCLPVEFTLSLEEDGKGASTRDVASALLSATSNLAGTFKEDFKIEISKFVRSPQPKIKVSTKVPMGTKIATLYIEGPLEWYLIPVRATKIEDGKAYFNVSLADVPKSAKPLETKLTYTLVADGVGIEQKMTPTK